MHLHLLRSADEKRGHFLQKFFLAEIAVAYLILQGADSSYPHPKGLIPVMPKTHKADLCLYKPLGSL
jgi:hypothetical protein